MTPNTPEPAPAIFAGPFTRSAHWLVMQDFAERAQVGFGKYGTLLTADNGRNHLVDAYQELLDLLVYLRLALEPASAPTPATATLSDEQMAMTLDRAGWWLASPHEPSAVTHERMAQYLERQGWFTAQTDEDAAAILREAGYTVYKVQEASATLPGIPQTEEEVAIAEALIAEHPIPLPPELATPPDIVPALATEAAAPEGQATLRPARADCVRFAEERPCYMACLTSGYDYCLAEVTPEETVLQHCAAQLATARGMRALPSEAEALLRADLARHGIPPEAEYDLVKHELARKDKRFPVVEV